MEYEIENITFSKDTQYEKTLYWKLFRIFYSLENTTKELDNASCVAGEYGPLLFRDIIDGKNTDNLYNNFMNEIKLFGVGINQIGIESFNSSTNRYYDRITKSIPKNILKKIQNIELFKLGYLEKNIYDELMAFKNELKEWLENPKGTDIHYDIYGDPFFSNYFHDQVFTLKKEGNKLELIGEEHIVCEDCNTIIVNSKGNEIINDYKNSKDYEFRKIEGCTYYGVCLKDSEKKDFFLETFSNDASNIIIETNSIKCNY